MKIKRQAKILEIVSNRDVETQEQLLQELQDAGFYCTQATVSRDIRELHLIKVADGQGKSHYSIIQNDVGHLSKKYSRVLKDAYVSMDTAGNLLVMKTVPGMAMAAAAALDSLGWPEILGCIAGDDTIMCAIHSPQDAKVVMGKLMKIIEG